MDAEVRGCGSRLRGLVRGRRALEAQWLFMAGGYARSGDWQADGFLSAAAALQKHCRMDTGAARRALHLANRLERLPATQKAFDAGEISRAHTQVIANGYTDERAEQLACIEEDLVDLARTVDPKSLRASVQRYTDAIDGDGGAGNDEKEYGKNRFHASKVGDRVRGDLSLDPEAGEIVSAAVEAIAADLRVEGDQRRTSQRHAEALVEICRRSLILNHKNVSPSKRRRGQPHLSFIVDLNDHETDHPDLVAAIRVEGERYGRLSQATLQRLTCDCNINRVITNGESLIIDVGRTTRNISGPPGGRSSPATDTAPNPAAPSRPATAKPTTSGTGKTAAPPTSPTCACCAGPTTENTTSTTPENAPDNTCA